MLIGIVEKNQNIRYLLQLVLEYEHHQVEFLEHHGQRRNDAVLLIDPGTPQQGIPVLRALEGTPSIILSVHDAYRWLCQRHHLPLLPKPFHLKDLVALVDQVGTGGEELRRCDALFRVTRGSFLHLFTMGTRRVSLLFHDGTPVVSPFLSISRRQSQS